MADLLDVEDLTKVAMTRADHWLHAALAAMIVAPWMVAENEELLREELAGAVAASDSRNPHVQNLHAAAIQFLARPGCMRADHAAKTALQQFALWRMCLAREDSSETERQTEAA